MSSPSPTTPASSDAARARERFTRARETVAQMVHDVVPGRQILRCYSEAVLALVAELARPAWQELEASFGPVVLTVVGGGGRLELGPYSDVDLVVLAADVDADREHAFEQFGRDLVHPLWDAGVRASIAVHEPRTWIEASEDDLTLCTALLDVRPVCGSADIVEVLRAESREHFFGERREAFLDRLKADIDERHGKYGKTVYLVEPDLKWGPGGLRDWASVGWALNATYGTRSLERLVNEECLRPGIAHLLEEAIDELFRLRAALHLSAKRAQDRLVFQYQESIAPMLGLAPKASSDEALVEAIERAMQTYYRAAHDILRYGRRLFDRCYPRATPPPPVRRLDERFGLSDEGLVHDEGASFLETPVLALDAVALARDRSCPVSPETFDAIAEATATWPEEALDREPEAHDRFFDILCEPDDFNYPSALELCNELRLLERVVPEFAPIRGRMQHDPYHVYTVDEHTLRAVAMLKRIARGEHNKDHSLATALHLELEDPRVLYLATLVHDTGKAQEGDQCVTGAAVALQAARRLGLDESDAQRCAQLVREHLTMPLLSQKRDLSDPLLIAEFAEQMGSATALKELYLLSLVDMAQVRPGNVSSWKLALLDELYLLTRAHMRRGVGRRQQPRVRREDEPHGMPIRYYSLFHLQLRQRHAELIDRLVSEEREAIIDVATSPGAFRFTVVARDRRGLLARITEVFDAHGLEVLAADVFSTTEPAPVALDVFRVAPHAGLEQGIDAEQLALIERALDVAAPSDLAAPPPRKNTRWRRHLEVKTRIFFDTDPSGARTIVEVQTGADTDVLRRTTLAFAAESIDIMLARCSHEADRASSVFYVPRLTDDAAKRLVQRLEAYLGQR